MSRSSRKTPITGVTYAESNKAFKQQENRRKRRLVHSLISVEKYDDMPHEKKFGNEWASPRDGKCWWPDSIVCNCFWAKRLGIDCWCDDYPNWYAKHMRK